MKSIFLLFLLSLPKLYSQEHSGKYLIIKGENGSFNYLKIENTTSIKNTDENHRIFLYSKNRCFAIKNESTYQASKFLRAFKDIYNNQAYIIHTDHLQASSKKCIAIDGDKVETQKGGSRELKDLEEKYGVDNIPQERLEALTKAFSEHELITPYINVCHEIENIQFMIDYLITEKFITISSKNGKKYYNSAVKIEFTDKAKSTMARADFIATLAGLRASHEGLKKFPKYAKYAKKVKSGLKFLVRTSLIEIVGELAIGLFASGTDLNADSKKLEENPANLYMAKTDEDKKEACRRIISYRNAYQETYTLLNELATHVIAFEKTKMIQEAIEESHIDDSNRGTDKTINDSSTKNKENHYKSSER